MTCKSRMQSKCMDRGYTQMLPFLWDNNVPYSLFLSYTDEIIFQRFIMACLDGRHWQSHTAYDRIHDDRKSWNLRLEGCAGWEKRKGPRGREWACIISGVHKAGLTAEYPATWVNLFLHMSRSLKICAQVESWTIVAGYSAVSGSLINWLIICHMK